MIAREMFEQFKARFGPLIDRADLPSDHRLFVYVDRSAVQFVCQHIFRELDARYVQPLAPMTALSRVSFWCSHLRIRQRSPALQCAHPIARR